MICFSEKRIRHCIQILSKRDNLHEMSNPFFWKNKKNITDLSFAELAKRVVKVNLLNEVLCYSPCD